MSRGWRDWKPGLEKRPNFDGAGFGPDDVGLAAPIARGRTRGRSKRMNKTETAYAQHLQLLQHAGEITWFAFEALKLRLADATFYEIDFVVLVRSGELEIHEVKGHWEDDARVKIKVAAQLFPFRFIAVKKDGQNWITEEISAR